MPVAGIYGTRITLNSFSQALKIVYSRYKLSEAKVSRIEMRSP